MVDMTKPANPAKPDPTKSPQGQVQSGAKPAEVKAPNEIKGREAPIPTDAPKDVKPATQGDSVTAKEHEKGTEVFKAPQGERIQEEDEKCVGIAMHVGAPKHCPKCPDKTPGHDRNFHRAEPGR